MGVNSSATINDNALKQTNNYFSSNNLIDNTDKTKHRDDHINHNILKESLVTHTL